MDIWKNKSYVYLFLGRFIALIGDGILFLTLLKEIELAGYGAIGISIYYLAAGIPAFIFALPAGAFVEKKNLQKTMISTDILRGLIVGLFILTSNFIFESTILI